jgi:site-specific DNA recombinase
VNLREVDLLPRIDAWLAWLTDPDHLEATCYAIAAASDQQVAGSADRAAARQLLADCDRRLARYRVALEAGTDPTVVGQWIAEVTTARQAAEASLHQLAATSESLSPAPIRNALGPGRWAGGALEGADPVLRAQLYEELGIEGIYDPHARIVEVRADLRRPMVRVGGVSEGDLNPHALAGHEALNLCEPFLPRSCESAVVCLSRSFAVSYPGPYCPVASVRGWSREQVG